MTKFVQSSSILIYQSLLHSPARDKQEMNARTSVDIVVFDWDETILPAWRLSGPEKEMLTSDLQNMTREWELVWCGIFAQLAASKARVFILTNAGEGHVEQTCQEFFPKLWFEHIERLSESYRVVSARSNEAKFPNDLDLWKFAALQTFLAPVIDNASRIPGIEVNLFGVGDAPTDRKAMLMFGVQMAHRVPNINVSCVKLPDKIPCIGCIDQTKTLGRLLENRFRYKGHDIILSYGDNDTTIVRKRPT